LRICRPTWSLLCVRAAALWVSSYWKIQRKSIVSSCDTPKITLNLRKCRPQSVRFVASERAGVPDSESRVTELMLELCLVIAASLLPLSTASADTLGEQKELYKVYAHTQLLNDKQYQCLDRLWDRESRWDPTARNSKSTAYGIPQILGMKETNPFKQIDLGLKYIHTRWHTPCNAYIHHMKVGTY